MDLTKQEKIYLWISIGTTSVIVLIVAITFLVLSLTQSQTTAVQRKQFKELQNLPLNDIMKLPSQKRRQLRKMAQDKYKNTRYAFVYSGQPRTWEQAVPEWHEKFAMYKPDIYLMINSKELIPEEKLVKVFGPNAHIRAIHYWSEDDQQQFNMQMSSKHGKMLRFCRNEAKNYPDVQNETRDDSRLKIFATQFAQLEKLFKLYDFTKYDVVVRCRMDATPIEERPFNIHKPWNKISHVVPHIPKLWRDHPDYKDEMVPFNGRNKSQSELRESYTLGGAYFVNPKEYYENLSNEDQDKIVWMMNDHVYWSTGKNMTDIHTDVIEKYGDYLSMDHVMAWAPEAGLFLHIQAHGLKPLMVLGCIWLVR